MFISRKLFFWAVSEYDFRVDSFSPLVSVAWKNAKNYEYL